MSTRLIPAERPPGCFARYSLRSSRAGDGEIGRTEPSYAGHGLGQVRRIGPLLGAQTSSLRGSGASGWIGIPAVLIGGASDHQATGTARAVHAVFDFDRLGRCVLIVSVVFKHFPDQHSVLGHGDRVPVATVSHRTAKRYDR